MGTIAAIRGHHVGFAPATALGNAAGFIRRRDFLLLEIEADDGTIGWGEVGASPWAAAALIRHGFARQVIGQPAAAHGRIFEALLAQRGYDQRGVSMMAISAIDMALHDVAARRQGVSVAALRGGALRNRVPAYASGPFMLEGPDPYAGFPRDIDAYLRRGFRAIKPRAGAGPAADGAMAEALRRQVGPDVALMVDFNRGVTARAGLASAQLMAPAGLLWIEEPTVPEDLPGYRMVAQTSPIGIAGGEALGSLAAFRELLETGAVSVVQPDLSVCGGYSGYARVAALCAAWDLPVMPHVFGTLVNFHASLQAAALTPSRRGGAAMPYPFLECDVSGNPLLTMLGEVPLDADGMVRLPEGPGAGFDLRAEQLSPWLVESWSVAA
ncbi:mandelate racemase/muconate lactonizing enzyme family protein [Roseomonas terrae]|uniref:Mandelate racemase/muconate lactonizing enzyme family protein n=1 Tax=Neoroseomonas terrae TaxID=424799 RepID=A0ABS5ECD4_9PROT|nr:mandelate racemase/muconate lactonizing enzyme family protein [Neoroseomonas terrae]MBR0648620.1 mandelate racemase/muconate lactonizing enzyme family protein [Neoroseomonas terrae]